MGCCCTVVVIGWVKGGVAKLMMTMVRKRRRSGGGGGEGCAEKLYSRSRRAIPFVSKGMVLYAKRKKGSQSQFMFFHACPSIYRSPACMDACILTSFITSQTRP